MSDDFAPATETINRSMIASMAEGVCLQMANGEIAAVNPAAARILGLDAEQMVGRIYDGPPWSAISEDGSPFPAQLDPSKVTLRTGRMQSNVVMGITGATGSLTWISVNSQPLMVDGESSPYAVLTTFRDVTAQKFAERSQRRLHRELEAISKCNQTLLRAEDEQTLLNDICRIVCYEAGYRMAWVAYRQDDAANTIRPVAWRGIEDGVLEQVGSTRADTELERPTAVAMRSGQSVCIQDFAIDQGVNVSPWRGRALERGYRSCIALPLKDENKRTFGVLSILSVDPNAFTDAEVRLLEELSGDLAFGITVLRSRAERKRLEQQRQANLHFFTSMDRVNVALQETSDLEPLMGNLLDVVLSIFDCDRAWLVYPCDIEAVSWRALMERTRPEYPGASLAGIEVPMGSEIQRVFGAVLASNDPVAFGPGSAHPLPPSSVTKQFSIQSMLATAIRPPTDKPYMFGLHQCSYPRAWTVEEQTLFQAIGHRLADRLSSLLAYRTLRQNEVRLRESLARVERLVDSNIMGVFFWSLDGRIDEANDGFLQLLGYSRDDLVSGKLNWRTLTPPEYQAADAKTQEQIMRTRTTAPFEKEYFHKDGTRVPVLVGFALREKALAAGMNDHITKPINADELFASLAQWVRPRSN